jgi:hypothetical protein
VQRSLLKVRADLAKAEKRAEDLDGSLREAEEAARDKTEELSEAITRLRMYEKGECVDMSLSPESST